MTSCTAQDAGRLHGLPALTALANRLLAYLEATGGR
jgi:hypothetical protein